MTRRSRTPRLAAALMLASLVVPTWLACGPATPAPAPPIPNGPDGGACPGDESAGAVRCRSTSTCEAACDGLRRADCEEGAPSPDGHPCEEVCRTSGRSWPLACWADARTPDDVRRCGKTRCLKRAVALPPDAGARP